MPTVQEVAERLRRAPQYTRSQPPMPTDGLPTSPPELSSSVRKRSVPDPCQILRGTTGNTGDMADGPPGADTAPPQVRRALAC